MFQKEGGAMFRILVAEDDHAIRTLITTKLKQENYTIYTVENGEEALLLMEKHQVDLLISDIMMPVMDGYSLVKETYLADFNDYGKVSAGVSRRSFYTRSR